MIKICSKHISDVNVSYVLLVYPQDIFHNINQSNTTHWIEWGHGGTNGPYL